MTCFGFEYADAHRAQMRRAVRSRVDRKTGKVQVEMFFNK